MTMLMASTGMDALSMRGGAAYLLPLHGTVEHKNMYERLRRVTLLMLLVIHVLQPILWISSMEHSALIATTSTVREAYSTVVTPVLESTKITSHGIEFRALLTAPVSVPVSAPVTAPLVAPVGTQPANGQVANLGSTSLEISDSAPLGAPMKLLGLPYFKQEYRLSCEEASLRMVLAKKGIVASDMDILKRVGYDPKPRDARNNSWTDPNSMFVGDVNQHIGEGGWGVYAEPVARAARSFGATAEAYYDVDPQFIAEQLYLNKAVVIWGAPDSSKPDSWNTINGGSVFAARNDHTVVVEGVVGTAEKPLAFYINDPLYGKKVYSPQRLASFITAYNNRLNMVVVVDL